MRVRVLLLAFLLLALFGVVLARAAKVQLLDRSRLSRLQRDQTRRELEWVPRRGMIVDRRGEALAVTRDVDSVFADPSAFETPRAREVAVAQLAGALRLDRRKIAEKLAPSDRRFVWIKRRIDEPAAARVRALALDGIELVKEPKRFYPQREMAGHVLGFVGEDAGQEGLERELEPMLRGRTVQIQATRDARGNMVLEHGVPDPADLTGATVTLTLDSAIQLTAEKELGKAVKAAGAIGGWAVVLDVRSGAVLALAGNPVFDANKPGRDPMVWRDRAVQDQLEPGSTIKSFDVARAIEAGVLPPDELLYCEHGVWAHAGKKIHDTHPVDWAMPATVLRESSNICAAKIGEKLGKEKMIAGLKAFGFGEKTGVGLPGEARGALGDPRRMAQIALDTTAFGQGMSATALPTAVAMVVIDEPSGKGNDVTGGMVAAPAWGAIAREALRQLDVMPDEAREAAEPGAIVKRGARTKGTLAPPG